LCDVDNVRNLSTFSGLEASLTFEKALSRVRNVKKRCSIVQNFTSEELSIDEPRGTDAVVGECVPAH
jgi:hypothetical protein